MNEVENNELAKDIPEKNFWFADNNAFEKTSTQQRQDLESGKESRKQWITYYDQYAKHYRACRYIETFSGFDAGHRLEHQAIQTFINWHDRTCQVNKELQLA